MEPAFLYTLGTAIFVGGVSAGMVKATLNGTKERVKDMADKLQAHILEEGANDMLTHERLASVESKLELLIDERKRAH